jgi:serine/threonine-protein phosphatase 6 regulatory ankyrin repeat subunit B
VRVLHGAQVNRIDWWGWYPLHHAAFKGLATVCRELVRLGASIDCVNRDGSTPLMLAARHGRSRGFWFRV